MTTIRKTRAPRKFNPFRMSSVVSCTISVTLHTALLAHGPNKSKTIRDALLKYAHQIKPIKVPDEYRPPKDFNQQVSVSLVIKPEALRYEYEHHAAIRNIPLSELILRCLYAHLIRDTKGETHRQNT
jgi:hypothetical protein